MKHKIYLGSFFIIMCLWASFIIAQTIGTPSPVNITNDGYNSAGVTDRGSGNALDVNIVTGVSGSSSVTGTVFISNPSISTNVTNTVPVSFSSPTVNQGTNPWITQGTVTSINIQGVVDLSNSTTSTLNSNATFTGSAVSMLPYSHVVVLINSNVQSATNGLQIQFSSNGTNWEDNGSASFTDTAIGQSYIWMARGQYYRIIYTNGNSAQSYFRLQSILKSNIFPAGAKPINMTLSGTEHAVITQAVLIGKTTGGGGGYVPVKVNPSGTLTVDASNSTGLGITTMPSITGNVTIMNPVTAVTTSATTITPVSQSTSTWNVGGTVSLTSQATNTQPVTQGGSPWITAVSDTVDSNNSTTITLGSNATFTGNTTNVSGYTVIRVIVYSNVSSATPGLFLEYSSDGTNWDDASPFTFVAGNAAPNAGQIFGTGARAQYFRVVYINGSSAQTTFRLQTLLKRSAPNGDFIDVDDTPLANNHVLLTKNIMTGKTTAGGGSYVDVKVNPSGALTVDATNSAVTTSATSVTPVSGTVSLTSQSTNTSPVTQATTTWNVGGAVSITNPVTAVTTSATSVTPVSGTFWQTTQPVSGTFWQATQPVSGTVTVASLATNTQPVTITNPVTAVTTSATSVTPVSFSTPTVNQGTNPWSVDTTISSAPTSSQVLIGNTATLIRASNSNRYSLCIRNQGTNAIYIGPSGVTTATGMLMNINDAACFDRTYGAWYGITSTGTSLVGWIEE